jgi:hypothetical protein
MLARCLIRACPVRFSDGGPDRYCRDHQDDGQGDVKRAAAELGIQLPDDDSEKPLQQQGY